MNDSIPPEVAAEIRQLWSDGKKIEAIKRLREVTGLGLKECKDAVENLAHDPTLSSIRRPTKISAVPQNSPVVKSGGCFSVILLGGLGLAALGCRATA